MLRHEIVELTSRYSFKEIEEYCGMPKRTLKANRKVPKKYWAKMQEMGNKAATNTSQPVVADPTIEPRIIIKEIPKEVIKWLPAPDSAEFKLTHQIDSRGTLRAIGEDGRLFPCTITIGQQFYTKIYLETANVSP